MSDKLVERYAKSQVQGKLHRCPCCQAEIDVPRGIMLSTMNGANLEKLERACSQCGILLIVEFSRSEAAPMYSVDIYPLATGKPKRRKKVV